MDFAIGIWAPVDGSMERRKPIVIIIDRLPSLNHKLSCNPSAGSLLSHSV